MKTPKEPKRILTVHRANGECWLVAVNHGAFVVAARVTKPDAAQRAALVTLANDRQWRPIPCPEWFSSLQRGAR